MIHTASKKISYSMKNEASNVEHQFNTISDFLHKEIICLVQHEYYVSTTSLIRFNPCD